jgi:hypothetical protein
MWGVMVWAGLWLRDPRLRGLLTLVEMRRGRGRPERPAPPLNVGQEMRGEKT